MAVVLATSFQREKDFQNPIFKLLHGMYKHALSCCYWIPFAVALVFPVLWWVKMGLFMENPIRSEKVPRPVSPFVIQ